MKAHSKDVDTLHGFISFCSTQSVFNSQVFLDGFPKYFQHRMFLRSLKLIFLVALLAWIPHEHHSFLMSETEINNLCCMHHPNLPWRLHLGKSHVHLAYSCWRLHLSTVPNQFLLVNFFIISWAQPGFYFLQRQNQITAAIEEQNQPVWLM